MHANYSCSTVCIILILLLLISSQKMLTASAKEAKFLGVFIFLFVSLFVLVITPTLEAHFHDFRHGHAIQSELKFKKFELSLIL